MSDEAAPTLDSVRKEARAAIFFACFQLKFPGISQGRKEMIEQWACSFAEFGVRSKLLKPDEGNEWLDAVWGRKTLASVATKYSPELNTN